jgi:uncharacterized membrane protein
MKKPGRFCPTLVAVVAVALCWPIWEPNWFGSHEGQGYVLRTVEFAAELERGILYPRWCPDFYGGYGSPFFVFYAPLVYAAAAWATLFGASATTGLKLVVTAASVAAGLGCYAVVKGETGRRDAGLLASAIYLAAPYRLANLYVRGDLAEFTALALLPGVLAFYRAVVRSKAPEEIPLWGSFAALAHAAMILSHTLVGLWGTELIAISAIGWSWFLVRRRAHTRALALIATLAFALALSAVYTGPALLEKHLVRIDVMTQGGGNVIHNWLFLSQLLREGMFDVRGLLAALGLGGVALVCRRTAARAVLGWVSLTVVCVLACLPIATFVWRSGLLPFGAMIQFPWRLLGFASLGAALTAGLAWALLIHRHFRFALAGAAAFSGGLLLSALPALKAPAMSKDAVFLQPDAIRARVLGATDNDEYLPRAVQRPPKKARASLISSAHGADVEVVDSTGSEHRLSIRARAESSLVLALHHYPGWSVDTERGPAPAALAATPSGYVSLHLPKPGQYELRVRFGSTPLRSVCALISLLALFLVYPALTLCVRGLMRIPPSLDSSPPQLGSWVTL